MRPGAQEPTRGTGRAAGRPAGGSPPAARALPRLRSAPARLIAIAAALAASGALSCLSPAPSTPHPGVRIVSGSAEALGPLARALGDLLPGEEAGAAIALVEGERVSVAFVGSERLSPRTLFEFGSITKVATANLVAQRVLAGALDLDTGLDRLPGGNDIGPQWSHVTLRQLLTHSAGLPEWPPNWGPLRIVLSRSLGDPFATYDGGDLLAGMRRNRAPATGSRWRYSNYAFAIAGRVLEHESGAGFESLMRDHFLHPLAMHTATTRGWSGEDIAPPRSRRGGTATNWSFDAFAPAGALRGSLPDAIRLLRHAMTACERADLVSRATCLAEQPAGFRMKADSEMGLGWVRTGESEPTVIWHNGGTGGYSSFLGFAPARRRGVVILTNVGFLREIDGLAMEALAQDGALVPRAPGAR